MMNYIGEVTAAFVAMPETGVACAAKEHNTTIINTNKAAPNCKTSLLPNNLIL